MPELPEVETTVNSLKQKVLGKTFVCIWTDNNDKSLQKLAHQKIEGVKRVGKNIFIILSSGNFLFIHLRMTGHLLWGLWDCITCPKTKKKMWQSKEKIMQEKKNGYLRFVFLFDNNKQLALSDPRKFAKVKIISLREKEKIEKDLGVDPLKVSKKDFLHLFSKRKKAVKVLLMDQKIIAGIGNIYAAEILFKAKINPQKRADYLSKNEKERIYNYMQEILQKAIVLKGDSTSDYRLLNGFKGGYQNCHLVYNRKDDPCFYCGEKIVRIVVGGRGTYFCPKCQK